jgi:hypothetical protein
MPSTVAPYCFAGFQKAELTILENDIGARQRQIQQKKAVQEAPRRLDANKEPVRNTA